MGPRNIIHNTLLVRKHDTHEEIDLILKPEDTLEVGEIVYRKVNDHNQPIPLTVTKIIERRPSRGCWKVQPVKDWAKIYAA